MQSSGIEHLVGIMKIKITPLQFLNSISRRCGNKCHPDSASVGQPSELASGLDRPLQKQAEKIDTERSTSNHMHTIWTESARKQSGARKERIYTGTRVGIPHLERLVIGGRDDQAPIGA